MHEHLAFSVKHALPEEQIGKVWKDQRIPPVALRQMVMGGVNPSALICYAQSLPAM